MEITLIHEKMEPQEISSSSGNDAVLKLAEHSIGLIASLSELGFLHLDPARVTNAVSYLINQVEAFQGSERLFLLLKKGQSNELIFEVLLGFKNRPEGFIANSALSTALDIATDIGNLEVMNFILAEFGDRLDLDEFDALDVIETYIHAGDENQAIHAMTLLNGVPREGDLRYLKELAENKGMNQLSDKILARLEDLKAF